MAAPILASKLHLPPLRSNIVQRPQLMQTLNEGLDEHRKVTLVSAPAGYGKTTCISEWVHELNDWHAAWLSLDPLDDDPVRFFAYFITALQKVQADLGHEIQQVLGSGQLPPGEIISTTLINELIAGEDRILLVLDDFHVIQDPSILQTLGYLIENIPGQLHLVLITREDPPLPLARLRANNQLTEVRARDLRFTQDETGRLFREVLGLSFSQADVTALDDKIEGWIAGLQLAAMAMNAANARQSSLSERDRAEPSRFIARLSGSHRYILSYLTEQVLDQQPEAVRQFLLETAILEKMKGDLCNAVTGSSDSAALLEQLERANLFLIPLEEGWYRYHHLFADLLLDRHQVVLKEKTAELHRRASRWFSQVGMINEAIRHALAAEDYGIAVDLLESHAMEWIMQGYAKTVNGWVQALPEEWRSRSPRTNLAFAWALMLRGAYSEATLYLDHLQTILTEAVLGEDHAAIYAEWLVLQSLVLYMNGKLVECRNMASEALEYTREPDHRVRSLGYYVQASVLKVEGDYQQAAEAFQSSIHESRAAASPVPEILSTASLVGMALEHGQLHLAFEVASQAADRMKRSGVLYPISAMIYATLGEVCYQWYQLDKAQQYFQQALHLSILGGANTIIILCRVLLSRLSLIEGDLGSASREIQSAMDLLPLEAPEYVRQEVVSQRVRVALAQGRLAAAVVALQELGISDLLAALDMLIIRTGLIPSAQPISSSGGLLGNSILCVLLDQCRTDPSRMTAVIEVADRIIASATSSHQYVVRLEALLLRAQMRALSGDEMGSTTDYVQALELAEPEGFVSIFIEAGQLATQPALATQAALASQAIKDLVSKKRVGSVQPGYIERILEAFSSLRPSPSERPAPDSSSQGNELALIEPLTERELEVLHWMGEGLKYQEIGERLYISKNTVRYHVKAIYGKLQVNDRVQAIVKARRLHLL